MNHAPITSSTSNLNAGRMRPGSSPAPLRPLFLGDWLDALFIHYQVDAERLQREVPYQLDLFEGRAFVSLVAFKMRRLRPAFGGWLAETLFKPIANTAYLNVRTYVRNGMEPGIYFIAEFLSNPLCIPLGPKTFGLPYHLGRLKYARDLREGVLEGRVRHWRRGQEVRFKGTFDRSTRLQRCARGSLDEFLLERYTAFTMRDHLGRLFCIRHEPWPQVRCDVILEDDGLLATTGTWIESARLDSAHFSPGLTNVLMGRPHRTISEYWSDGGLE